MVKFLFLLFICSQSFGQHIVKQLDSVMQKNFTANQPGAALLMAKNGKLLYQKGIGLANVDTKLKISAITNFRMASVSKQFTAMCIMLLQQQHKISYEDNLLKFFPNWNKTVGAKIKIKHLLTHSSGIWDYEALIPENQTKQISDADVVTLLMKKDSTYFTVGSTFQYSNAGFCVLEQIIEKASGLSYVQFIEQHIFKPIGMNNTRIFEEGKRIPNRAMGFAKNEKNEIIPSDQSVTSATKGDGCVYTSLNDYLKWADALIGNKLINVGSQLKRINHAIEGTTNANYGLGWFNARDTNNELALYHTGSTCGFSNVVKIIPKNKLIIVFFSNMADNHKTFYEVEALLKRNNIDESEFDFRKMLDLTR
jgi:CubicO group peptidase (beta-lactamase class C family)